MGLFGPDPKPRTRRDPMEVAQDNLIQEQRRAGRAVIEDAYREAEKKNGKAGIARGLVKLAEAKLAEGDTSGAATDLGRALGDTWARKLRTAVAARGTRVRHKAKPATEEAPPSASPRKSKKEVAP